MPIAPVTAVAAVAALLGLIVGSFLNVVIYRLPVMLDRDWRRQAREVLSPACKTPIKAYHNIPVLSYVLLRGRCAACSTRIPLRYPVVEALTGAVSAAVALRFGFSMEGVGALLLCWSLIDHQILPDAITLPLLWLGMAIAVLGEDRGGFLVLTDLRSSVIGAMAGYLSLWLVYQGFRLVTGKEGMGYGDFKLLAVLGAWLGWQVLPLIILLSALVGAVTGIALVVIRGRDRQLPLPFGPYLAAAGFVALLWGQPLMGAYRGISGF